MAKGIIKSLLLFIFIFFVLSAVEAQVRPPKREFRAVWVASVVNIDWPSAKGLSSDDQKAEFIRLLDSHQSAGINAVMVQIRPATDALYFSKKELWSEFLTGKQGDLPKPYYDPLMFMIDESHKRNMEFHAWLNPYRAVFDTAISHINEQHITKQKPNWFISYGKGKVFDPAIPEVRNYIVDVMVDVVQRYDLDGVHFDDYFYPYPIANQKFNDDSSFVRYANGMTNRDDWRRKNVDDLIKKIADAIKKEKPHVKFGISPFAVWRNQSTDPQGSPTDAGTTTYDNLYADVRGWLQKEWIDYIVPQIYFTTGFKRIPYFTLTDWWTKNSFGRHLYIGQAAYKVGSQSNSDSLWRNYSQLPNQIRFNRLADVQGSVYFSSKSLIANLGGFRDSLATNLYRYPALPPQMKWKDSIAPAPPKQVEALMARKGFLINWLPIKDASYYVVYRFSENEKIDIENATKIVGFSRNREQYFTDKTIATAGKYRYCVTSVDRLHNESSPSNLFSVAVSDEYLNKNHWYDFIKTLLKIYAKYGKT